MADDADRAGELIDARMAHALAARTDRSALPSLSECACGEPIPAERQALGGITRCVECERDDEQRRRHFR